ncbi:MAG: sulfate reduction electron transfer complex DsrMKJOP subunit DsrJ [Clostridia bacterium]|nr:sulfate reduction electron transfer complex DsrMKJOP subunit DsrJ [Clostridia bacterium]
MRDFRYILTGLAIFVAVVTFPLWINAGKAAQPPDPSLDTPAINQLPKKQCIEATDYMRQKHMQLLDQWRTEAIREGKTVYTASDGQKYQISLENTCLSCHSNKSQFCDQCHNYLGVEPDCFSCHQAPDGG